MSNNKNIASVCNLQCLEGNGDNDYLMRMVKRVFDYAKEILSEKDFTKMDISLISGYCAAIDKQRCKQNIAWKNIPNAKQIPEIIVRNILIGLDARAENHVDIFFDGKTNDIGLRPGYLGRRYIAEKYAPDDYKEVRFELVYDNDHFKPIKRSVSVPVENYEFDITDCRNRGKVALGFGYVQFEDSTKNILFVMTRDDFEQARIAGINNSKAWEKWYDEMCLKTLILNIFHKRNFPYDPRKIDDILRHFEQMEIIHQLDAATQDTVDVEMFDVPKPVVINAVGDDIESIPIIEPGF